MNNYITLSQRDPKWAQKTLGFTRSTIGLYGCTLTVLTCLINRLLDTEYTPEQVNQRLKEVRAFSDGMAGAGHGIGTGNLIVWARVPLAFPMLKYVKRVLNYNNVEVAWWVYVKDMPVMVEVNAAKIGAIRHWCLYIGNKKMVDPWTGRIVATNEYPATGYSIFDLQ